MRKLFIISIAGLLATLLSSAHGHTIWLEPAGENGVFRVLFGGHAGKLEVLEADKLRSITALDASGDPVDVERMDEASGIRVRVPEQAVQVAIHYDNGIWTRDPMGRSINQPMNEVRSAVSGTWALKYHKTVLDWADIVSRPLGHAFEMVPVSASQPVAGVPMRVQVLLNGEPAAGVRLGRGEEGDAGITNADGVAEFVPGSGFNRLWAGRRLPVDEATHTEVSYEYLMSFEARPRP